MTDSKLEKSDAAVDTAADKLQQTADSLAGQSGVKAKLAKPLADDAEFLRKLKPSLMVARAKGEAPTDEQPTEGRVTPSPAAVADQPDTKKKRSGPSPWLVLGIALAAGILVARMIDWRGHAHPRD
jgi:hypothetical protein